jgi:hypothetical protein
MRRAAMARRSPGEVRDAILGQLRGKRAGATIEEIHAAVEAKLGGAVARSSVRSYLNLNTGSSNSAFERIARGRYRLRKGS